MDLKERERLEKVLSKYIVYRKDSDCFGWSGATTSGYPRILYKGKAVGAHRVMWSLKKGEVPPFWYVRHTCNNRMCTNIEHLYISKSKTVNRDDSSKVHRMRLGIDLPLSQINLIREMARKRNMTVTKYVFMILAQALKLELKND